MEHTLTYKSVESHQVGSPTLPVESSVSNVPISLSHLSFLCAHTLSLFLASNRWVLGFLFSVFLIISRQLVTQRHGVCVSGCAETAVSAEFAPGGRSDGTLLFQDSHFLKSKKIFCLALNGTDSGAMSCMCIQLYRQWLLTDASADVRVG